MARTYKEVIVNLFKKLKAMREKRKAWEERDRQMRIESAVAEFLGYALALSMVGLQWKGYLDAARRNAQMLTDRKIRGTLLYTADRIEAIAEIKKHA